VIEVFSDGSSSGTKDCRREIVDGARVWLGPGGYGWVLARDGVLTFSGWGGHPETTNNVMEMTGAILGLEAADGIWTGEPVVLISDSQYVLGIASGAMHPTKNKDLSNRLRILAKKFRLQTRWVRGHLYKKGKSFAEQPRDVLLNERCDQLAKMGKEANVPLGKAS
jgi:ribonuclease HI